MEMMERSKKYAYGERLLARGELNHNATLERGDYALIKDLIDYGMPRKEIAEKFEISKTTMQRIAVGKHWLCKENENATF